MIASLRVLLERVGAVIWPPRCYLCGRAVEWEKALCDGCAAALEEASVCIRCGARLADPKTPCPQCTKRRPPWQAFFAAYRYEEPLPRIFGAAKYHNSTAALRVMVQLAHTFWQKQRERPAVDFVTWVPPDPRRLWQRGYDVAGLLAEAVAGAFSVDVRATLRKKRTTPPQAGRSEAQRRAALVGVFEVTQDVKGCRVLLVDDLATTCTTLRRCARLLKRAGAEVTCFVLAR